MSDLVGYARVSTGDQTLNPQLDALRAAGCLKIFSDDGVSGSQRTRAGLTEALDYLRAGDTLVVVKLDRAARSLSNLIQLMLDLAKREIGFRSLGEAIDTGTAAGRLLLHVLGAIAEFERDLIIERTRAGLASARARGRVGGAPVRCTPDKTQAARLLIAAGSTVVEAAALVGVSERTLHRHLSNTQGKDQS